MWRLIKRFGITSYGSTSEWGIGVHYNNDYKDVSFDFMHWYFALGFRKGKTNDVR